MSNICLHTGQVSWPPSNHRRIHRLPITCPQGSLTGRSRSKTFLTHIEFALGWRYGSRQIAQAACSEEIGTSGSPLKKVETSCFAERLVEFSVDLPIVINISAAVRISSLHLTWFVDDIVLKSVYFVFLDRGFIERFSGYLLS